MDEGQTLTLHAVTDDGDPTPQAEERGHIALESLDLWSLGNLPGTKHLGYRSQGLFVDRRS